MKHELNAGIRRSKLSPIYRHHSYSIADGGSGRLLDWTRHVDGDWRWYCPYCARLVILQEEKKPNAAEKGWSATRRAATHHEDRPWAWLIITHDDGTFTVTAARATDDAHDSLGPRHLNEEQLISWIERAFRQHWEQYGHPLNLIPVAHDRKAA